MDRVKPFVQPSSCVHIPNGVVTLGGPELLIPVGNRVVLFEQHHYFGPTPINKKTGEEMTRVPSGFYDAYERWTAGGKLVQGNLCVIPEKEST